MRLRDWQIIALAFLAVLACLILSAYTGTLYEAWEWLWESPAEQRPDVVVVVPEEWLQLLRWPTRIACAAVSLGLLCLLILLFLRQRRGQPPKQPDA